jgi:methionyl-tRNA formyltransferase
MNMPFRFICITQEDPFYVRLFFEEFLRRYPRREEIAAVVIAPAMGKRSVAKLARQMYDFYGPLDFVRMGLRFAFFKVAARLGKLVGLRHFYSIEQVCHYYNVPAWRVADVNAEPFLARLRQLEPDLIVSVAAPQIFRRPLLSCARHGAINIHNSKLPRYRGMLPNFWQMYHGEKTVGTTIHRINDSVDDGPILLQMETPINPGETLDALIRRTKRAGAAQMIEVIAQIKAGTAREIDNPRGEASYFTFPSRDEVREFRRRGYRLV